MGFPWWFEHPRCDFNTTSPIQKKTAKDAEAREVTHKQGSYTTFRTGCCERKTSGLLRVGGHLSLHSRRTKKWLKSEAHCEDASIHLPSSKFRTFQKCEWSERTCLLRNDLVVEYHWKPLTWRNMPTKKNNNNQGEILERRGLYNVYMRFFFRLPVHGAWKFSQILRFWNGLGIGCIWSPFTRATKCCSTN